MSPNQRVIWGSIVLALSFIPAGSDVWGKVQAQNLSRQQQESQLHGDQVKEAAIERNSVQTARDEKIALKRAERCILIDEQFPLVEGGNAFYNPLNRDSKRLLPANTALCSAQSGYTALVDEAGTVSSIKQAPIEKLTQSLKRRGVIR